jgi:hypothetical protein
MQLYSRWAYTPCKPSANQAEVPLPGKLATGSCSAVTDMGGRRRVGRALGSFSHPSDLLVPQAYSSPLLTQLMACGADASSPQVTDWWSPRSPL